MDPCAAAFYLGLASIIAGAIVRIVKALVGAPEDAEDLDHE